MDQQVPGVRRWRDGLDEQVAQAFVDTAVGEREIQCALHLSAELPRLAFSLPAGGQAIRARSIHRFTVRKSGASADHRDRAPFK
ncbi:MAG: hypothetical protein ABI868_09035 [Acidobacteriota bacterium]